MRIAIWPDGFWIDPDEEPEEFQSIAAKADDFYIQLFPDTMSEEEIDAKVQEQVKADNEFVHNVMEKIDESG